MARARASFPRLTPQMRNELWGVLLLAGSLFLLMSLVSYHAEDLGFFTSHPSPEVRNRCGLVGAWVAGGVREAVGWPGFLLPVLGVFWSLACFNGRPIHKPFLKGVSTVLLCLSAASLLSIVWTQTAEARVQRGGVLGILLADQILQYFGWWGAVMFLLTVGLLSLLLATEMAVWPVLRGAAELSIRSGRWLGGQARDTAQSAAESLTELARKAKPASRPAAPAQPETPGTSKIHTPPLVIASPPSASLRAGSGAKQSREIATAPSGPRDDASRQIASGPFDRAQGRPFGSAAHPEPFGFAQGRPVEARTTTAPAPAKAAGEDAGSRPTVRLPLQLPSLDLLAPPSPSPHTRQSREQVEANAKVLGETLRDFGIEARVAEVELGPVIARYEVEPAAGVKIQKIAALADDLALALKAASVRVIAPIPGKGRVGIEVPNQASAMVTLREVLESKDFQGSRSKLTLAIGKDAAGHPLIGDLGEMPHLLIAGATGSGKTVCMNALILSMVYNATPDEVRFLMVDPKMVELSIYNGLPHLMMPVLTNPRKVPGALEWVIEEMETRYRLFAKLGVRNIEAYRQRLAEGLLPSEEIPEALPYLVIIIDELADLMLVAQAEAEKAIARLAHLSRAVGIHMVLATQRPSVDVLTGVIKANFPARISFQVASRVDSRTVLDAIGAEKLLGKGDLLYMPPGASKLIRAQGTLVTDDEIERVVEFLKAQGPPAYELPVPDEIAAITSAGAADRVKDPLYGEAVRVVVEIGQASVSLLQRRMRLGYGRAARILDRMEEEGIVGPIRGAKPREVYLKEISR